MRTAKEIAREKRKKRIRSRVFGTAVRPRITVFKSLNNIYVQAVDDDTGKTIVSSSTIDKKLKEKIKSSNIDAAKTVGADVAKKLKAKKINSVVFDRSGYIYHGKIKALADAAREAGLKF